MGENQKKNQVKKEVKTKKDSKKISNKETRKTMRKSEKTLILILAIITIVVTSIYFVLKNKNNIEEIEEVNKDNNTQIQNQRKENISVLEDGTKLNISKKTKEIKKVDGLEFSDIEITEKDNITVILANVKNTTKETKKDYIVDIKVLDKNNNEITSLSGYIGEVKPNETTAFKTSATFDFADAYDIIISKK